MIPIPQTKEKSRRRVRTAKKLSSSNVQNPRDFVKYATNPQPAVIEIFLDETGKPKVPDHKANVPTPIQKPMNYMKYADNPEYAKLEIHLDENGKPKVSTASYKCSIGCCFGITVQVFNANGVEILVTGSRWGSNTPFIGLIIQDQYKSKAVIFQPDQFVGVGGPSKDLGWISPGEFNISVIAITPLGEISGQASITVVAPIVQELYFESLGAPAVRQHADGTNWLEFGPVKTRCSFSMIGFSGTAGFVQFPNTCIVRKSAEGTSQTLQTTQDVRTINHIGRTREILYSQEHLDASEQKALEKVDTPGVELNSSTENWTQYTVRNSFKTYVAFQPDPNCAPGVIRTFIVRYNPQYVTWGWSATAVTNDTMGWIVQNPESSNVVTADSQQWDLPLWNNSSFDVVNNEDWSLLTNYMI